MDTPFIGLIAMFGFNFAPIGWAFCNGQLLPIAQYQALFALLGTTFGGDGQSTFALPNMQSRVAMHMGQGPGLTARVIGEMNGVENKTLITTNIPTHKHSVIASSDLGDTSAPVNAFPANTGALDPEYKAAATNAVTMAPAMTGMTGGNQPFQVLQPFLTINYCIALEGVFPSRN